MGPCGAPAARRRVACTSVTRATTPGVQRVARDLSRGGADAPDGVRGFVQAEVLRYTYPDQRHDVEAMYVAPNGDIVLITKRPLPDRERTSASGVGV